uniref:Uncharacterized protein n=1 Tax=Tanacetum cinerariifolium TaxID=118510 RepID=A0A6L2P5V1_TANCI|nr:hypothetical protein [Tanacetum cinerariifolium]
MLDFDDEDEDEGEEQNEEFTLYSTNTIEWSTFVPFKVGKEAMKANTTPYLPTLEEPILSAIDDIQLKKDEEFLALSLYEDECLNSLEEEQYPNEVEAEVTHILNPPQFPRVVINQVGVDDSVFENKKEQKKGFIGKG